MRNLLQRLFCHHEMIEITRYFEYSYSPLKWDSFGYIYRNYYLDVYKKFKCSKCGKIETRKVLDKEYMFLEKVTNMIGKLRKLGYVSLEELKLN